MKTVKVMFLLFYWEKKTKRLTSQNFVLGQLLINSSNMTSWEKKISLSKNQKGLSIYCNVAKTADIFDKGDNSKFLTFKSVP